jgi:hypothetical protein
MPDQDGMPGHEAERLLRDWAAGSGGRDGIVLAAHRAGVTKHRIHLLTGIARTTLDRILSQEDTMDTAAGLKSRKQEELRQRTISALLGSGLTSRDAQVFLGVDPVVVVQLAAEGDQAARRDIAGKMIAAFRRDSLRLLTEPAGVAADEAYLADGGMAEVHELG